MPSGKPPVLWPPWLRAFAQALLVALYVLLAFLAIFRFHSKLAMASLAASAFIAFGFPSAQSARSRFLLGGYACGVVCGAAVCYLRRLLPAHLAASTVWLIFFCALAVFLTAFFMILLNLQHPPAAALAVSMVLEPAPLFMGLSMLACILVLVGIRRLAVHLMAPHFPPSSTP